MIESLRSLVSLQKLDTEIRKLRDDLRAAEEARDKAAGLAEAARAKAESKQGEVAVCEAREKELNVALAAEKEKLIKWEKRLRDIQSSRDYAALQREIEGLKRQNFGIEEEMLKNEEAKAALLTARDALMAEHAKLAAASAEAAEAARDVAASVQSSIDELTASRNQHKGTLDASLISRYEMLLAKRNSLAVARINNQRCGGCNMMVPPQQYNILVRGMSIETCRNCTRIIYVEEVS